MWHVYTAKLEWPVGHLRWKERKQGRSDKESKMQRKKRKEEKLIFVKNICRALGKGLCDLSLYNSLK